MVSFVSIQPVSYTHLDVYKRQLLIQAADNGKGIGPEEAGHLFDRYYRGSGTGEKPEGTGLGLAIAKSIIELHGGTISAYGTPGAGTVFSIEFPVS